MNPHPNNKGPTRGNGTFSTWTSNYDGTVREVGLYRSNTGTVEKKMFTNIRDALDYGFQMDYRHRSGITWSDFLAGKGQ